MTPPTSYLEWLLSEDLFVDLADDLRRELRARRLGSPWLVHGPALLTQASDRRRARQGWQTLESILPKSLRAYAWHLVVDPALPIEGPCCPPPRRDLQYLVRKRLDPDQPALDNAERQRLRRRLLKLDEGLEKRPFRAEWAGWPLRPSMPAYVNATAALLRQWKIGPATQGWPRAGMVASHISRVHGSVIPDPLARPGRLPFHVDIEGP